MAFTHSPKIVTDGLVVYLDAGNSKSYPRSGTDWTNVVNSSMTGSIVNSTFSTSSLGAFTFDKIDDYVLISSGSPNLNIGTNHTWVWWMKKPDTIGSSFQYIYSHNTFAVANSCVIFFGENSNGNGNATRLYWTYSDTYAGGNGDIAAYTANEVTSSIANNKWHMVTLVKFGWNAASHILYVDDNVKFTNILSDGNGSTITKCNPTGPLNLFRRSDGNSARYWQGDIGMFMMYKDKALTEQEVIQNFNATRGRYGV